MSESIEKEVEDKYSAIIDVAKRESIPDAAWKPAIHWPLWRSYMWTKPSWNHRKKIHKTKSSFVGRVQSKDFNQYLSTCTKVPTTRLNIKWYSLICIFCWSVQSAHIEWLNKIRYSYTMTTFYMYIILIIKPYN